jgi:hypothetical protein
VKEIASGVNDSRPKLLSLLKDTCVTRIVIEHKDRLTRFGFHYLETLLETQGRTIEVESAGRERQRGPDCRPGGNCLFIHCTALWATAGQTQNRTDCPGIASEWRRVMNEGPSLLSSTQRKRAGLDTRSGEEVSQRARRNHTGSILSVGSTHAALFFGACRSL